jgi:hypothetical protein
MKNPVQNIRYSVQNHSWIMLHCGGDIAAHCGRWPTRLRVVRQRRASGRIAHRGGPLFHKAKGPASFHSIKGMDNLISIEDRDEPVHCTRGVM